jgi:hypothetical protein
MKRLLALLFVMILAAALCGQSAAQDPAGPAAGKSVSKVSKEKKQKAAKQGGKAAKKKKDAKAAKKGAKPAKKPDAVRKSAPATQPRPDSPFSTPPPGTGYGNMDPAPAKAPPAR